MNKHYHPLALLLAILVLFTSACGASTSASSGIECTVIFHYCLPTWPGSGHLHLSEATEDVRQAIP